MNFGLCLIDPKQGRLRRYERLGKPRHAGDETQVLMTHEAEVDMDKAAEAKDDIERFRVSPEEFFK